MTGLFGLFGISDEVMIGSAGSMMTRSHRPELNFTYLDHDGTNAFGSTAFRVWDDDLVIFIEAFPNSTACDWDPETITRADVIIQAPHGHMTHYDADEVATVAKNTGAYLVGNSKLKSDMTARGISSSKIFPVDVESITIKLVTSVSIRFSKASSISMAPAKA